MRAGSGGKCRFSAAQKRIQRRFPRNAARQTRQAACPERLHALDLGRECRVIRLYGCREIEIAQGVFMGAEHGGFRR